MVRKYPIVACLALAATIAWPRYAQAQAIQLAGSGTVEYRLVHKFHTVVGTCRAMMVRGAVDKSGLRVMARAQVQTFDSGNTNRDAHMMEALEGEKYPWVSVRAALAGFRLPTDPGTTKIRVDAAVELHGVSVNHPIDVTLDTKDGTHFHVSFQFTEKLSAHNIERPSLLFVPVDDDITIVGSAKVEAKK